MPETCAHSWSCERPHSCDRPGPCVKCGAGYPDPVVATLRDIAEHFVRPRLTLMAAELSVFADRLEAAMRGEQPHEISGEVEFALAYGGEDPNDCARA